jgi:hypothetical protein
MSSRAAHVRSSMEWEDGWDKEGIVAAIRWQKSFRAVYHEMEECEGKKASWPVDKDGLVLSFPVRHRHPRISMRPTVLCTQPCDRKNGAGTGGLLSNVISYITRCHLPLGAMGSGAGGSGERKETCMQIFHQPPRRRFFEEIVVTIPMTPPQAGFSNGARSGKARQWKDKDWIVRKASWDWRHCRWSR